MPVLEDLNSTETTWKQIKDARAAKKALEDATRVLDECCDDIQRIVDSGNFNTIPVDLRQALNQWWTIVKTAKASIEGNADIQIVCDWRP